MIEEYYCSDYRGVTDDLTIPHYSQLEYNLAYAVCMARIHYLRDPEPLPKKNDVWGLAEYYKRVWNTEAGKATVEGAVVAYMEPFCM